MRRRYIIGALAVGIALLCIALVLVRQHIDNNQPDFRWWLVGSTLKIEVGAEPPAPTEAFTLSAARGEYAPFQLVLQSGNTELALAKLSVEAAAPLSVTLLSEQFLSLEHDPVYPAFAQARLSASSLPDGLRPLELPLTLKSQSLAVVWVDLYVPPTTPAGSYLVNIHVGDQIESVPLTVYPVDLSASGRVSLIVPIEPNWTMPFYGVQDPSGFQRQVNDLLLTNRVIPGSFVGQPRLTASGWDFRALTAEMTQLPPNAQFFVPTPYDAVSGQYRLQNPQGEAYTTAQFDDPDFVSAVRDYFSALAAYLKTENRFADALFYPYDETRWVGDEPIHNGADGFARLAQWADLAHQAGFRVIGSQVLPVAPGPASLGWTDPSSSIDVSHVEVDTFDGAGDVFARWTQTPDRSVGFYLNGYGDQIDYSAAIQRGLLWHAYGHGVDLIAGYGAMQWVNSDYNLVDPWTDPQDLFPQTGYGGGALIWPGPLPSLRLKLLREGLEDTALLDLYAKNWSDGAAQAIAQCLTPGRLLSQNPASDQWDNIHTLLLKALSQQTPVELNGLCPLPLLDMDQQGGSLADWNFVQAKGEFVASPWSDSGQALRVSFSGEKPEVGFWFPNMDWSGWSALQFNIRNEGQYFIYFNVGFTDGDSNFIDPVQQGFTLGPGESQTIEIPLKATAASTSFDFSSLKYLSFQVQTSFTVQMTMREQHSYPLGDQQLTFDNVQLIP
ncbi:MAG: hypothetical protein ABI700_04940 [Chloroflexota bacterium]